MERFIAKLPKAELHLHIEGALEAELAFRFADRNRIKLPYRSVEELKQVYTFKNLQDFLSAYYQMMQVLQTEDDFYELTYHYLEMAASQCIRHVEIFFDPQAHMDRGLNFEVPMNGILAALKAGKQQLDISYHLIPNIMRDRSLASATKALEIILNYKENFLGIGLDSAEIGFPPEKFQNLFAEARAYGLLTFAHAGEEGPVENIWQAINLLKVRRIDHGVRCIEDESLLNYLANTRIPLTTCPLSNIKLNIFSDLHAFPIKTLLSYNICATVNSDDPAYVDGYLNENYFAITHTHRLTKADLRQLAVNSFHASVLPNQLREKYLKEVDVYCQGH
ncbi:MAG: adenosine deaminase [Pseudomonadota bacterium]